jgi:hypothetical protein
MSAFADYLDLRLAVSEHVGNRAISDVFPRLVKMAEATLNKKLRTRQQITNGTLTFTDGVAPLPADCLEIISLFFNPTTTMRAGSIVDTRDTASGDDAYAVSGSNVLVYGATGTRSVIYFAAIPTLTTSTTTSNWLLAAHPQVYLYAVGFEAAKFLRDPELAAMTDQLFAGALNDMLINDERDRWANGIVRQRTITP